MSIDSGFDGDGNRISETSTASLSVSTTYYLRSTVLGAIVEDLNSSGQKLEGYVFSPSGSLLASQVPGLNYVMHKQLSPIGVSQYEFFASDTSSGLDIHRELDAAGAMIPLQSHSYGHGDTFGDLPDGGGGPSDSRFASIAAPAAGCVLDGIWVPCSMAYRVLESGAARVCPDNDCSPRRVDIDIRYRGGGSQRISGLVADPFYDVNFTFRGAPAQSAAEAFLKNGSAGLASRIDSARDAGLKALIDALRHHPSPQNPYDPRVDFRDYAENLSRNKNIDDCQKLALLIYKAGQAFGGNNPSEFSGRNIIQGLMSGLTGIYTSQSWRA